MKLTFNYRKNHKTLLNNESGHNNEIYKKEVYAVEKFAYFLQGLLEKHDGEITVNPDRGGSWYSYDVNLKYQGYDFNIHRSYSDKLTISIPSYYKYSRSIDSRFSYFPEKTVPQNYTFYKLSTKKLLIALDFEIEKVEAKKKYSDNQNVVEFARYETAKKELKFIADAFDVELRITKDDFRGKTESAKVYLTDYYYQAKLEANWDENSNESDVSFDIAQFVKLIKKLQNK